MKKLTLGNLLVFLTFSAIFLLATRPPLDMDTFWHLRAGEWQWEHKSMLSKDFFSHTHAGEEWINHGWPVQIVLFLAYDGLGDFGLLLFTAILAAAGLYYVYRITPGDELVRAAALILAAMAAAIFWVPRPLMVSFALSGLLYSWLWRYQREDKPVLWRIPILMLVWNNLHGAGVNGFILLVLAAAGEGMHWFFNEALPAWKRTPGLARLPKPVKTLNLAGVGLLSAGLMVVHPYGLRMLQYPFFTFNMQAARQFIQEWQSPDFHTPQAIPFLWMLLATLLLAGLSSKRLSWRDAVMVGGTAYASLNGARIIPTFAIAAAPVLADHLSAWLSDLGYTLSWQAAPTRLQNWLNWLLVGLIGLGGLGQTAQSVSPTIMEKEYVQRVPVEAAAFLQDELPPGTLFNSYNWGGYLIWAAPSHPVYVDSRADLMGDPLLLRFLSIYTAQPGWQEKLAQDQIDTIFVESGSPLALLLSDDSGWEPVYRDDLAVIFTRR